MKNLEEFINESFFRNMRVGDIVRIETQLKEWVSQKKIKPSSWTINKDLTVDVKGDVWLSKLDFKEIPVKFNKVSGWFSCSGCTSLKSLEGAPKEVGGGFYAQNCGKQFSEAEVLSVCKVSKEIYV